MNIRKLFIATVGGFLLTSCIETIEAEGPMVREVKEISSTVENISIEYAMNLTLSDELEEGEIAIITNENIHQYINIRRSDKEIKIELADIYNYRDVYIYIEASSKQFSGINASGASKVSIEGEGVSFDNYSITLSGASEVNVETDLIVKQCTIEASGASIVKGKDFLSKILFVDLSGASKVTMCVDDLIYGDLSGASILRYFGDPKDKTKTTGASVVEKL